MKQFKKTTKTDKSICVSSRVKYIFERIKTYDELYYFIKNVTTNNIHELIGGRSIASLIAPLINDSKSRKQFHGFGYCKNVHIELKDYGIRVIIDGKRSCVTFGNLFNKIFKVSTISVLDNGNFSFVIKHEPSTGNDLELANKKQNDIDEINIKEEQTKLEIERNRLVEERRMLHRQFYDKLNEIESKMDNVNAKINKNRTKLNSFSLRF